MENPLNLIWKPPVAGGNITTPQPTPPPQSSPPIEAKPATDSNINPVIAAYFHDQSIPTDKKQNLASALDGGHTNVLMASTILAQKYPQLQPVYQKFLGDSVAGVVQATRNPAPAFGKAAEALGKALPAGVTAISTPQPQATNENNYGLLQPLRAATAGIRQDLNNQSSDQFLKNNPELLPVANIANSQFGKNIARMGGSAIQGITEGIGNQLGTAQKVVESPLISELKKILPDKASQIDQLFKNQNLATQGKNLANSLEPNIQATSGQNQQSSAAWWGGGLGKIVSQVPAFASTGGAGELVGGGEMGKLLDSTIQANIVSGSNEGRPANAVEVAGMYGVNKALDWLGGLFSKIETTKPSPTPTEVASDTVPTESPQQTVVTKIMKKAGVNEYDAYLLNSIKNNQEAKNNLQDYLRAGFEKVQNRSKLGPYETAAKPIQSFMSEANAKISDLGIELRKAKNSLNLVQVSPAPLRAPVQDLIKKYNVHFVDGLPDFANSEIKGTAAEKKLTKLWKIIKAGKDVNGRDLEAITGQIDQKLGTLVGTAPKKTPNFSALSTLKTGINQAIGEADKNFGEINTKIAKALTLKQQIEKVASEKIGKNTVFNPAMLLRRDLGNLGNKYSEAIKSISDLGNLLKIDSPKNLDLNAHLSSMAEKITIQKANSIAGLMESTGRKVVKQIVSKIPVINTATGIAETLQNQNKPIIEKSVKQIIDYLSNAPTQKLHAQAAEQVGNFVTNNIQKFDKPSISIIAQILAQNGFIQALNQKQ